MTYLVVQPQSWRRCQLCSNSHFDPICVQIKDIAHHLQIHTRIITMPLTRAHSPGRSQANEKSSKWNPFSHKKNDAETLCNPRDSGYGSAVPSSDTASAASNARNDLSASSTNTTARDSSASFPLAGQPSQNTQVQETSYDAATGQTITTTTTTTTTTTFVLSCALLNPFANCFVARLPLQAQEARILFKFPQKSCHVRNNKLQTARTYPPMLNR